jgi:hypothetical protein
LIYGWAQGHGIWAVTDLADYYLQVQNCTLVGNGRGIKRESGSYTRLTNVLASGNTNSQFDVNGGSWGTCSNNASSDGTAPGTNSRTNQTFTFVDAANKDYHLAAGDAGAKDYGTSLSGSFTIDIDGETRSGTWDIGADEYVAAAAAVIHFLALLGVGK